MLLNRGQKNGSHKSRIGSAIGVLSILGLTFWIAQSRSVLAVADENPEVKVHVNVPLGAVVTPKPHLSESEPIDSNFENAVRRMEIAQQKLQAAHGDMLAADEEMRKASEAKIEENFSVGQTLTDAEVKEFQTRIQIYSEQMKQRIQWQQEKHLWEVERQIRRNEQAMRKALSAARLHSVVPGMVSVSLEPMLLATPMPSAPVTVTPMPPVVVSVTRPTPPEIVIAPIQIEMPALAPLPESTPSPEIPSTPPAEKKRKN